MGKQLNICLIFNCFFSPLEARAITIDDIYVYTISAPASNKMKISVPIYNEEASIQLPLLAVIDNDKIVREQISDHTLEGHLFQGDIPVYTWNLWAYGALNGFSSGRESDVNTYRTSRFQPQVQIIRKLFKDTPDAIVCLQEISQNGFDFIVEIQRALSDLNVGVEYCKKTGTESFGQIILYKKDKYQYVRPSSDKNGGRYSAGTAASYQFRDEVNVQDDRVLKVYFKERSGKRREIAVVNVHLKWYPDTDKKSEHFDNLMKSLIGYAKGAKSPAPAVIITGDFNYDLRLYTVSDSKITIHPVGRSYTLNQTGQAVKVTDGFIEIQP
ncbi:MAG: hypothetical protein H6492_02980 [Candidatus Paracaedibacteraceae bacterium]|nr:hypothetical protein [Candidatus Paracaedibacteraceae bacterium]